MTDRAAVAADPTTHAPSPLRTAAKVLGAVFLLVGILGFVPGITTNYDELAVIGQDSGAQLLGLFAVSYLHNAIHLLYGVAGFACAATASAAHKYLVLGGMGYLVVAVFGTGSHAMDQPNFIPVDVAGDILHWFLGFAMIGLGYVLYRRHRAKYGPF